MTITKAEIDEYSALMDEKKKSWPAGPWQEEPHRHLWEVDGYECLIIRNHLGALCGYVGVQRWHPWFEKFYDNVDASVHGGLTFAGFCTGIICHPGRDRVWWLGFDCAHYMDVAPGMLAYSSSFASGEYRNIDYVRNEVLDLLLQAQKEVTWKHKIKRILYNLEMWFNWIRPLPRIQSLRAAS